MSHLSFFCCTTNLAVFYIFLILQVFILQVSSTTCHPTTSFSFVDFDSDQSRDLVHLQVYKFKFNKFRFTKYKFLSVKCPRMPVVTRSLAKPRITKGCISPASGNVTDNLPSFQPLVYFQDVSESLSSSLPSNLNLEFETQFEVSNMIDFEISNFCQPCTTVPVNQSHNSFQMESECKDNTLGMKADPDPPDGQDSSQEGIMKVLMAISSQMVVNTQDLQDRISKNTLDLQNQLDCHNSRLTQELQRLNQEHEVFKQEIRQEMLQLRGGNSSVHMSMPSSGTTSAASHLSSTSSMSPVTPTLPSVSVPATSSQVSSQVSTSAAALGDPFQTQILQMLNETFTKLSTVLSESKNDAKSEWPKFSGDISKFRDWYLAIMAQISLSPWNLLYDPIKNDIVESTSNSQLNSKLYAKLLVCLEGQAMKNMVSRKHVRANGILLLQELHQMYKLKNVPEVIAAKTAEFWSKLKRSNNESVDSYYNRFHELLDEINDAKELSRSPMLSDTFSLPLVQILR